MPYFASYTFEVLADLIVMPWGIFKTTVGRYKWYLQDKYVSVYLPGDYCSFRSSKLLYLFTYDTSMSTEGKLYLCIYLLVFIWGRVKDEEGRKKEAGLESAMEAVKLRSLQLALFEQQHLKSQGFHSVYASDL